MPPSGPRNRLPSLAEGLTSKIIEFVREYWPRIHTLADLKQLLADYAPMHLEAVVRFEQEGFVDPIVIVHLLDLQDAHHNLDVRGSLLKQLARNEAVVLLPLPPHLHWVLNVADARVVFNSDPYETHQPRSDGYHDLAHMSMTEAVELVGTATAVVAEGFADQHVTSVRATAADLIYLLSAMGLENVYLHAMPHLPPRERFVPMNTRNAHVTVWEV